MIEDTHINSYMHKMLNEGGLSILFFVVAFICIDMHHCVVSLKEAHFLVQKEGLVECPKLKRGLGSQKGGGGSFRRENPVLERAKC